MTTNTQTSLMTQLAPCTRKLTVNDISPLLSQLGSLSVKLGEAAGAIVEVEIQMRLIGQLSEVVGDKLVELAAISKKKGKSNKYWKCDPEFLAKAIVGIFGEDLAIEEQEQILKFPSLRGKLLHGELVGLMAHMEINPSGRHSTFKGGGLKKDRVGAENIIEAIKSVERNTGLEKVRQYATTVACTLRKIIIGLAK